MISFREYQNILLEDFKPEISKNPQGTISYSHSVGDHKVHTHFIPSGGDGDYDVHFTRSGPDGKSSGFDRRGMGKIGGGDRVRMMHGMIKSIHHFVGEHKPKSITGIGNTKKKNDTFTGILGNISKKHGGKHLGNTVKFGEEVSEGYVWDGIKRGTKEGINRGLRYRSTKAVIRGAIRGAILGGIDGLINKDKPKIAIFKSKTKNKKRKKQG